MEKPVLICVDDQSEVLAALVKDLEPLGECLDIIDCDSADDALEAMEEMDADGHKIAIVISDHVMPGKNGVDFLKEVLDDPHFSHAKKMLLTGLATHEDTVRAINEANIDMHMAKPWEPEQLIKALKTLLTRYILEIGEDYHPYMSVIDQDVLYKVLHKTPHKA